MNTTDQHPFGKLRPWILAAGFSLAVGAPSFGWSISGTVKSTTGTVLAGVVVSVVDSSGYLDTTDAQGSFSFLGKSSLAARELPGHFSVRMDGSDLTIQSPVEGVLDLALIDASGRNLWSQQAVVSNGSAKASLRSQSSAGGLFLRVRHAQGAEYMPVFQGPGGLRIEPSRTAARAMAALPVLKFHKSGYRDTTRTMLASDETNVSVAMAVDPVCDLPTAFKWKDYGGPVAPAKNGWAAIKDFTHVAYNGKHYVYMTYYLNGWNSAQMAPFTTWADAKNAAQTKTNTGVAPELMYFTPKKTWIMSKQWCSGGSFCWMESSDVSNGASFSLKGNLLTETITDDKKAPIDQTLICDDNKCYIFYADDNGRIYRGSMDKAKFPGTFSGTTKILQDTQARLFEAVEVYKIKGMKKWVMIVECMSPRYFRAFTATDLGGTWTSLVGADTQAKPFAGKNNVTGGWSDDISHGDLVRSTYDEYKEIDPCNLEMIYQGYKGPYSGDYGNIPYQMGVITLQR